MVASKENFFKAHWDWLVALGGVVALVRITAGTYRGILKKRAGEDEDDE